MYYRAYYPTCVERKFGNISRKVATKCLIPSSRNEVLYYNSKLATNQIPQLNLHMKTDARSDLVRNSESSSLKAISSVHCIKRNVGKYMNCDDDKVKTVRNHVERSPKCCCELRVHKKHLKPYSNQLKHKIFNCTGRHENMSHRKFTGEYSKRDRKKILSYDSKNVRDETNQFKYKDCGKHLQGHVNIRVAGANSLEHNDKHKSFCNHIDPVCSHFSDDESMNFQFYGSNFESSSNCCSNNDINGQLNNEINQNMVGGNSYSLNYKNEVIKFDSFSASCKSICVDSKFKREKNYLEICRNTKKRDKSVENYLHNVVKRKRKICTKIFSKFKKFTDSKSKLSERFVPEGRYCAENPRNFPGISGSSLQVSKFDQLGLNYIPESSEINVLRKNLELLQERFRSPHKILKTQKGCGSKFEQPRSDCYYFEVTNENESTRRAEELQTIEMNSAIKNDSLSTEENTSSSDDSHGSPNNCPLHDPPICKQSDHLKIEKQNIKKKYYAQAISSNLQDISRILKIVHQQHREHCKVNRRIIRKKCIPHKRRFRVVQRLVSKNKSVSRSSRSLTNVKKCFKDEEPSFKNTERDLSARNCYEKQQKITSLPTVNQEPNKINESKKMISWKTDGNNLNELKASYLKRTESLNCEMNEVDSAEIGSQESVIHVIDVNSSTSANLAQEETDSIYLIKQTSESDKSHQKDIIYKRIDMNPAELICLNCGSVSNGFKIVSLPSLKLNKKSLITEQKQSCSCNNIENDKTNATNDYSYHTFANRTIEAYWTCCCDDSNPNLPMTKTNLRKSQECSCVDAIRESSMSNVKETCSCSVSQLSVKQFDLIQECSCGHYENSQTSVKEIETDCDNSLHSETKTKNVEQLNRESCVKEPEPTHCCCDSIHQEKISKPSCVCYNTSKKLSICKIEKSEPKPNNRMSTHYFTVEITKTDKPTQTCNCYPEKKDASVQTSSCTEKEQMNKSVQTLQCNYHKMKTDKVHEMGSTAENNLKSCKPLKVDDPIPPRKKERVCVSIQSTSSYDSLVKSLGEECNKSESGSTSILSDDQDDVPTRTPMLSITCSHVSIVKCQLHDKCTCQSKSRQLKESNEQKQETAPINKTHATCRCSSKEKSTQEESQSCTNETCVCSKGNQREIGECQNTSRNVKPKKKCSSGAKVEPIGRCGCVQNKNNVSKEKSCSPEYRVGDVVQSSGRDITCTCMSLFPDPSVRTNTRLPQGGKDKRELCFLATVKSGTHHTSRLMNSSTEKEDRLSSDTITSHKPAHKIEIPKGISHNCNDACFNKFFLKETKAKLEKNENTLLNQGCFHNSILKQNYLNTYEDFLSPEESKRVIIEQKETNERELYVHDIALGNQYRSEAYLTSATTEKTIDSSNRREKNMLTELAVKRNSSAKREILEVRNSSRRNSSVKRDSSEYGISNSTKSDNFNDKSGPLIVKNEKTAVQKYSSQEILQVRNSSRRNSSVRRDSSEYGISNSTKSGNFTDKRRPLIVKNEKTAVQKYSSQASFIFSDSKKLKDSQKLVILETRKTKRPTEFLIETNEHYEGEDVKRSNAGEPCQCTVDIPCLTSTGRKSGARAEYIIFDGSNHNCSDKDKINNMGKPIKKDCTYLKAKSPSNLEKFELIPLSSEKNDKSKKETLSFFEIKHGTRIPKFASAESVNTITCEKTKMRNTEVAITKSSSSDKEGVCILKQENIDKDHDKIKTRVLAISNGRKEDCPKYFILADTYNQTMPEIETSDEDEADISGIEDKQKRFKVTIKMKHKFIPNVIRSEELIQATSPDHASDFRGHGKEDITEGSAREPEITFQSTSSETHSVRWKEPKKFVSLCLLSHLESKDTSRSSEISKKRQKLLVSKLLACKQNSRTLAENEATEKAYCCDTSLDNLDICDHGCDKTTSYSETEYNDGFDKNDECFTNDKVNFKEDNSFLGKNLSSTSTPEINCNGANYNNSVVIINNYMCKSEQSTKYTYDIVTNCGKVLKHNEEIIGNREKHEIRKTQNELISSQEAYTQTDNQEINNND